MSGRERWVRAVRGGLSCGLLASAVVLAVGSVRAQGPSAVTANPYYAAPGNYGTSYGSASFGLKRTYSEFASPYGGGYAYGYPPSRVLPGRYGIGLWRPGMTEGGYVYGAPGMYRTFAAPYVRGAVSVPPPPPLGVYAPGFGPSFPGW